MLIHRRFSTICSRWLIVCLLICLCETAVAAGVDVKSREIAIALSTEPPSLNSVKATDAESFRIIDHISEGLMTYDMNNQLTGGVAERWELTNEGATFWLRPDALWEDGRPVTAHDFVFAWRQVVTPSNAAEYAFLLYPIRNAEQINSGDMPPESLGAYALDDRTLKVDFVQPCGYFLQLTAFISYRPIRQDFYQHHGERFAADAQHLLSNGPFKLTQWVHGASLRMERNPQYWNTEAVELNAINVPYITAEPSAIFNLFKDGKLAISGLDDSSTREALKSRMKIKKFFDGTLFFLEFNHRPDRLTRNRHLRKAMQLAFDVDTFVARIIRLPGNAPGLSLFPSWLRGVEKTFWEEYPPTLITPNEAQARHHLELARQELGVAEIPPLVLLLGDSPTAAKQAEYIQDLFRRVLGLEIKLDKQIFKQRLAKMTAGDFDIVAAGWGPDYDDTMTFADLMASWNLNNRGRFNDPEYDRLVRLAQSTSDPVIRNQAFADMQNIIIDDAILIPQYERGRVYVQDARLTNVVRRIFGGDPIYTFSRIKD